MADRDDQKERNKASKWRSARSAVRQRLDRVSGEVARPR
jgi:hypothetical protein